MSRWSALHAYLHGGAEHTETVLREYVVPTTGDLLDRGEISSWFFVRYWEGGPHLRWRVADASPTTVRRLRDGLAEAVAALPPPARELRPADWYAGFGTAGTADTAGRTGTAGGPDLGWHPHGTVLDQPYHPEVDRYGGPEAIGAAEELFAASSRVAATLLDAAPARRRSTTVDLLFGFLAASGLTAPEAVRFLRGYANGWSLVPEAHGQDLGLALIAAERDFHANPAAYAGRRRLIDDIVTGRRGATTSVNFWADAVTGYAATLRALQGQGRLRGTVAGILASQLHMLHNRLGLSIPAECHLAWLASFAYAEPAAHAEPAAPQGFHADTLDAADRRYHERSKFVRARWPEQHPRPVEPVRPDPGASVGAATLALPEPTPGGLGDASLAEVLLARRTRYDFGPGELDTAELGRLLRYAAGETAPDRGEAAADGEDAPVGGAARLLAYPSPGGLVTTRLMVLPRRVTGVPAALYRYLPERHGLQRVAADPGTARLARIAPQFAAPGTPPGTGETGEPGGPAGTGGPGGTGRLDVEAVALWLFVVADLDRVRTRYGLRGYRFAAVETGHLAQNLLLAATATGLSAAPVGGFYDDELNHLLLLDGLASTAFYAIALGRPACTPVADLVVPN
ncbi:thiopeptide-type bacteriocin biosynthesis protein [Micromonospora sp. NBC_01655]|uniref:thiopeptide-type bacteriocin biosynthesis protein n=1 Tax=Micromonospora sp. NBC_01655 TaxID=2975983 RepID=UPI0022524884|nr:thiopeptide-type bacteriocin biosynthesis protein [Micromonospora sp. NBC_01655]MCX4471772.1 thiopeptide-type bacteriocin biosynthesis protein [Micromonospora sp. NBC_01655]